MTEEVFELEKRKSDNWNLFFFELCTSMFDDNKIRLKKYDDESFGSWYIELVNNKRLVYDGRDCLLSFELKSDNLWNVMESTPNDKMTYQDIIKLTSNEFF